MTQLERLQQTGLRRIGSPKKGFHYETADGKRVKNGELERIRALRIPPAWTDVRINPSPKGKLQAVGKDAAGRWQYRYHPAFTAKQEKKKYERLVHFAQALPNLRKTIGRDINGKGLGRRRVMACLLRILSTCFIRPGSQVYAAENGSYGLATLRPKHVQVKGDTVTFHFKGKSGQQQHRELTDRRVAKIVRELLKTGHKEVFAFQQEDGSWVDVRRRHINEYIKEVMGERFSAKDFRTWAGTLICACALARCGFDAGDAKTVRKKKVVEAVKETAAVLGNTPAICKSSYIWPSVLSSFERGKVVDRYFETVEELVQHNVPKLHASETALLEFLKKSAA